MEPSAYVVFLWFRETVGTPPDLPAFETARVR